MADAPLYNGDLLSQLDFESVRGQFKPHITAVQPGEGLIVRPLKPSDYDRGTDISFIL